MHLEGSCHCGSVKFSVESAQPVPFMRCYCSICRKTAGAGGYAINLGADAATLKVLKGKRQLRVYRARLRDDAAGHGGGDVVEPAAGQSSDGKTADGTERESTARRHFCARCGSPLWLWDPTWPHLVHPHASAIDTPLPVPPSHVHLMLGSKANWVVPEGRPDDPRFDAYPDVSLAQWHAQHGLTSSAD
jgi:hypothetical protein